MARYLIGLGDRSVLAMRGLSSTATDAWLPRGRNYTVEQPVDSGVWIISGAVGSASFTHQVLRDAGVLALVDGVQPAPGAYTSDRRSRAATLAAHYLKASCIPPGIRRDPVSCVIVDSRRRQLVAQRDFFGTRPVYFFESADLLLVSNDLQLITAVPGVGREPDPYAVADFLRYGLLDFFDKTLTPFRTVRALAPATRITAVLGGHCRQSRVADFQDLLDRRSSPSPKHIPDAFAEVMDTAVRDAVRARRVLIALSGGLDSGAIAACAASACGPDAPELLNAVTALAGPDDPEAGYATLTATHLGIRHQFVTLRRDQVLADSAPSWYPTMNFHDQSGDPEWAAALKRHDVALVGAAGDSVLCQEHAPVLALFRHFGLRHAFTALREARRERRNLGVGSGLTKTFRRDRVRRVARIDIPFDVPSWLDDGAISELGLRDRWAAHAAWSPAETLHATHPQAQLWLQWANWSFSGGNTDPTAPDLQMVDPFLDWRVISFCFSIPPEPWMHRKKVLRSGFSDRLPREVLGRPKTPAGNYVIRYLGEADQTQLNDWSLAPSLSRYIRRDRVPIFDPCTEAGNGYLNLRPMMLQRWFDGLSRW